MVIPTKKLPFQKLELLLKEINIIRETSLESHTILPMFLTMNMLRLFQR